MIHHISLPVASLEKSSHFYDVVLGALGYRKVCASDDFAGYGVEDSKDQFSIFQINPSASAGAGFHLAFSATSREAVDLFHVAALNSGGACNGPPGLRKQYGPDYYAAFVIDPDGHRLEAVINEPVSVSHEVQAVPLQAQSPL